VGGSGISWTIWKSFVSCCRHSHTDIPSTQFSMGRMLPANSVKALEAEPLRNLQQVFIEYGCPAYTFMIETLILKQWIIFSCGIYKCILCVFLLAMVSVFFLEFLVLYVTITKVVCLSLPVSLIVCKNSL